MTQEEIDKLARWSNTLNHWEWPDDMPGKPDGWNDFPALSPELMEYVPNRYDWIHGILDGINKRVGKKEVLRWHHTHNLNKTNEEFEFWWENSK